MRDHRQFMDEVDFNDAMWDLQLGGVESEIQSAATESAVKKAQGRR